MGPTCLPELWVFCFPEGETVIKIWCLTACSRAVFFFLSFFFTDERYFFFVKEELIREKDLGACMSVPKWFCLWTIWGRILYNSDQMEVNTICFLWWFFFAFPHALFFKKR